MKSILLGAIFTLATIFLFAQQTENKTNPTAAEISPAAEQTSFSNNPKSMWDVHFSFSATASAMGDLGMAGIAFFNNEYWVSQWGSDTLYRFDTTGALISEFIITGLAGTRSITTDGTYLYIGNATNTIYVVDPSTQTINSSISSSASVTSRFLTYDPTLNNNAGGFWTGNFNTDIQAISMTGAVLDTILVATHGLSGMYGAAWDSSFGTPILWIFHQGGTNQCEITALQLPTGTATSYTHDALAEGSALFSLTSSLAGGAFITNSIVPGETSLVCMLQGTPENVVIAYDVQEIISGIMVNETSEITVFPNPTSETINIQFDEIVKEAVKLNIYDLNSKLIYSEQITEGTENHSVNVKSFNSGIYIIAIKGESSNYIAKIIIK